MRIQLPFEWWLDLFDQGMQQRDQLARLSNQTSDSQFSEVMQAWLHQRSHNIKLRSLILDSEMLCSEDGIITKRGALYRRSWSETRQDNVDLIRLPIAQVPLPPNISSFQWIDIKYLDSTLFEFLQKLRRLFIDVHIQFDDDIAGMWLRNPEAMRQAALRSLPHLLPLFAVKSIHLGDHEVFNLLLEHFPATVNGTTVIGLCNLRDIPELDPYHDNWLMNRRADGEPRLLTSHVPGGMQQLQQFRQTIQERFLASSKAVSYFISLGVMLQNGADANAVQGEILHNNATGEQMIVSIRHHPHNMDEGMAWFGINFGGSCNILFTRCPINVDAAWLEQKRNWASEWTAAGMKFINLQQPIECVLQDDQLTGPPPAEEKPETSDGGGGSTTGQQQPEPSTASAADQGPTTSSSN